MFLISKFIRNILFTIQHIINRQAWFLNTHIGTPCWIVNEDSRGSFAQVGSGNGHPLRLPGIQKAFQFLDSAAVEKRNTPLSSLSNSVVPWVGDQRSIKGGNPLRDQNHGLLARRGITLTRGRDPATSIGGTHLDHGEET
jgi:hypothetical protein